MFINKKHIGLYGLFLMLKKSTFNSIKDDISGQFKKGKREGR